MISMRPPRTECRAQPAGHACGPPLREAAARTAQRAATTTKSFARAGCEGRSCGREPAPAQGRMSIHWSQAPRQAGMYSRRSGWGAGGSLNLPDRTGTSAFLNRAQHQVNRILLPKQENISERDRGPCHSGSEGLPHRTERSGPGTWPAALRTSESRDFPNMLMRKSPTRRFCHRLVGWQGCRITFGPQSAPCQKQGFTTGPRHSRQNTPGKPDSCGPHGSESRPKRQRGYFCGQVFPNGHTARRPFRKPAPHPQNKAKPATGSALSAIVATAISPAPARSAPKRRGWRRSCSECRSGAASPCS